MKRKFLYLLIFIVSFFALFTTHVNALSGEDIHSNEAYVANMYTDEVLFEKNTNEAAVPIASLTKLMTYAVVVDEIPDLANTRITVPEGLVGYMKGRGASRADLIDGYEYSALDLLYGMMLPSGCDAAEALARYIGGGDPSVFVAKMNDKAASLGMANTYYIDSYGIGTATEDNMSTEQDLYKLIKYVYYRPYFRQIISTEYYEIHGSNGEEQVANTVRNTNYLMGEYSGAEYYNPYAIGGKTGSLDVAGKCLVTIAQKKDMLVVAITLGVPGEYGDYNLNDHNTILEAIFTENQENITVDIPEEYHSVEVGKQHQIDATTSQDTTLTWTSEDESVATVDQNGIVTGVSQGQAKIIATTPTGDLDYTYVSVNFYNGVHVKLSNGEKNPENENGYEPVDMTLLKNKGFDYVVIKAINFTATDKAFYTNFQNAVDNEMDIGIWVESYSENTEEATLEANYLLDVLRNVSKDKITLPVFYNVHNTGIKDPVLLEAIIKTFSNIIKNAGYEVVVEDLAYEEDVPKNKATSLENLNLDSLTEEDINLSVMYRPTPPDFKTTMTINGTSASIWNYKVNAYMGKEWLGANPILSLMYMNYKKIETNHKEYIPIVIIDDDPVEETNEVQPKKVCTNSEPAAEPVAIKTIQEGTKYLETAKNNKNIDKKPVAEKKNDSSNYLWLIFIALIAGAVGIYFMARNKE